MNMQQFRRWVARLLDALPWRRAHRPPKTQMHARMTSPAKANRFTFPDDSAMRRQKAETNPRCSTLHEDAPAAPEPPAPPQPLLLPPPPAPDSPASASLLALPAPPSAGASDSSQFPEPAGEPQPLRADPERRLAFARYLFKRGVFNEGFTPDALPAQYRDRAPEE